MLSLSLTKDRKVKAYGCRCSCPLLGLGDTPTLLSPIYCLIRLEEMSCRGIGKDTSS